ncbi:kinase-like domain-containing protein [Xylaria nigripes]|nr:kinase-like domain-containing protein [Xylaria nigripes]
MQRKPEDYFLRLAKENGVAGVVEMVGHCQITTINSMRDGLQFLESHSFRGTADEMIGKSKKRSSVDCRLQPPKRFRSSTGQSVSPSMEDSQCPALSLSSDGYNNRAFRCLVTYPAGRPIYEYESPVELLEALRDAIKAHESLYTAANILHRDISENNIIITEKKTGFSGRLIDLDLAKEVGSGRCGALCRTGTMEFMAIEVLLDKDHTYRHDLESFFYVLLWQCILRGWRFENEKKPAERYALLKTWYTGTFLDIALYKQGAMSPNGFQAILGDFPTQLACVKPLCEQFHSILFRDGLFTSTPGDHPSVLYGQIINAFDDTIGDLKGSGEKPASSYSKDAVGGPTPTSQPISTSMNRYLGMRESAPA